MKDFYQILGVSRTASTAEIKNSYRRLAKQYHPDVNKGDKQAEERFKEISEAYNVLSDAEQKKKYDMILNGGFGGDFGGAEGFGGAGPQGFRWQRGGGEGAGPQDFGDLGDLFSELFEMGGVRRRGYSQTKRGQTQETVDGSDTFADMEISFEEAVKGTERKMSVKRGDKVENLTVKIPAGVDNGSKVRIAGKGQAGFGGGKSGDLFLRIHVTAHPDFWREGADIYTEIPITIYMSVLGGCAKVPTIDGEVEMKIPAGTSGGQKFRIGGKGAPVLGKKGKTGDQYVIAKIVPPKKMKAEQKKAFEELAENFPYTPNDE